MSRYKYFKLQHVTGLIFVGIIFFTSVFSPVVFAKGQNVADAVDELHQMYADYNFIDNVYDHVHKVRESIADAMATNFVALSQKQTDVGTMYVTVKTSEDLALIMGEMEKAQQELEERKITPQLTALKKIVNEMIGVTYEVYNNYRKIVLVMAVMKDPNLRDSLKTTGSNEEKKIAGNPAGAEDSMKKKIEMDKRFDTLEEKLSQEQDKLTQRHKELAESIKRKVT